MFMCAELHEKAIDGQVVKLKTGEVLSLLSLVKPGKTVVAVTRRQSLFGLFHTRETSRQQ